MILGVKYPSILAMAFGLKPVGRAAIAIVLLGSLLVPMAFSAGTLVCTRGMAQAGPACPLCHGHSSATPNPCCKWIEMNAAAANSSVDRLTDGRGNDRLASPVMILATLPNGVDAVGSLGVVVPGGASPPGSSSRTSILRL